MGVSKKGLREACVLPKFKDAENNKENCVHDRFQLSERRLGTLKLPLSTGAGLDGRGEDLDTWAMGSWSK